MTSPDPRAGAERVLGLIESFDQLELLLILARRGSLDASDLADVVLATGRPTDAAEGLVRLGLATRDGRGLCLADAPDMAAAVGALRRSYTDDPLPIVQMLSRKAIDRVRTAAVQTFADSFLVRRKDG